MGTRLLIPVKVYMQGVCIEDSLLLDTGNNGYVFLGKYYVDKYSLDLTTDTPVKFAMTAGGAMPNISLHGDSIALGIFTIQNVTVNFSTTGKTRARMIGNKILENFTLILDFKNFYLYLKQNE
jgi:predicted aspartyl protease